jgi:serine/threonine protein kinase
MARCVELDEGVDSPVTAELLSCLKLLGHLATDSETSVGGVHSGTVPSTPSPNAADGPAALFPVGFGRFELRGVLGTGGFGVVFRAFDPELDREIALKIPRPDIAALPSLQSRFLREAQAAAALDHPGILPVFETGRIGPIAYISTALCCGPSLSEWLTVRHEAPTTSQAAELVRRLAQAVQHAHDRGVLHRDLKPSNVLLEPRLREAAELADYQPRITDFGLAKRLDATAQHTKEGALLGTPRYMAPEQVAARNDAISVRTDVYALGVILYELLAGSPPFVADSDVKTMAMILDTEPGPPHRPESRIDRDLASICLTCLRKAPAERYASARELADDLGRYLRGEPVVARPLSRALRTIRWCHRRPMVAALSGSLAVLLLAFVIGSWLMMARERTIRRAAEWKQLFAEHAIDDMYLSIDKWASGAPASEELRREFLLKSLEFYDALANEQSSDPAARHRISTALQRMANIQAHLRMPKEAAATRKRCLALLDRLVAEFPERNDYAFARFQCLLSSALDHAALKDGASESSAVEMAYSEIEALLRKDPDNPTYLDAASAVGSAVGNFEYHRGQIATAIATWNEVIERAQRLADRYPDRPLYKKHIAAGWRCLANHAANEERFEQAAELYARCASMLETIADALPEYYDLRSGQATAIISVAFMDGHLHRFDSVAKRAATADRIFAQLAQEHPHEPDIHGAYCRALWDVGYILHQEGQQHDGKAFMVRALEMARRLVDEHPDYLPHRDWLITMLRSCPAPELRDDELAAKLEAAEPSATALDSSQRPGGQLGL